MEWCTPHYSPISPASFGDGSYWTLSSVGTTPDDAIVTDDDDDDGNSDTTIANIICELKKIVAAINNVIGLQQQWQVDRYNSSSPITAIIIAVAVTELELCVSPP